MSCRILYVDDNQDSLELVNFMLSSSEISPEVVSADCAEQAVSLMENQVFDLFIIDYSLPQMSGTELCRYIRKSDSEKPILFFTAMARSVDRESAITAGANEFLVKPNDLERLTETVKRLLIEHSPCKIVPAEQNRPHLKI
jgi:CheY-like chemotaxis protein